jgi:hypothetical protein
MKMKKLGARIEKTWKGGGCKFIVGYKYHWPNVVTRLLSKIPIVFMFIRIAMHSLGSIHDCVHLQQQCKQPIN